jgi:hypothetical protein
MELSHSNRQTSIYASRYDGGEDERIASEEVSYLSTIKYVYVFVYLLTYIHWLNQILDACNFLITKVI